MTSVTKEIRRRFRKQVHKYWQKTLPARLHMLDVRFLGFAWEYLTFSRRSRRSDQRFGVLWQDRLPCLRDRTAATEFDARQLYGLAWAARVIAQVRPSMHFDLGSDLALSTLVSAFVPVRRLDTAPVKIFLPGLECGVVSPDRLPLAAESLPSISCIGSIEHVGLGRYGEPLDPAGDLKVMREILRVLKPGGALLFSAPVGSARIRFNARRVYSFQQINACFSELELKQFALIDDDGRYWPNSGSEQADAQRDGCGCWWFRR